MTLKMQTQMLALVACGGLTACATSSKLLVETEDLFWRGNPYLISKPRTEVSQVAIGDLPDTFVTYHTWTVTGPLGFPNPPTIPCQTSSNSGCIRALEEFLSGTEGEREDDLPPVYVPPTDPGPGDDYVPPEDPPPPS